MPTSTILARSRCLTLLIVAGSMGPLSYAASPASQPRELSYGVDFWSEAEGLPQSRVRAIVQTHDGYIWLGTDGGAVRFNGASFKAFTVETGDLRDNEVWALQEDNENALWIGTFGGGLTRLKDGRFQTFTTADGLPDNIVTRIEKDSSGDLWIATANGFSHYSHGRFTRIDGPGKPAVRGRDSICARTPGGVYFSSDSQILRLSDGRFEPLSGLKGKRGESVDRLTCAADGSLWVGFTNGAIRHWKKGRVDVFPPPPGPAPQVTLLSEDPNGGVWASLGPAMYELRDGRFERLPLTDERTDVGAIYSMYVDWEGSIWVGLQSNGLARLRVKQIMSLPSPPGLSDDIARCVFQDGHGDVWVGTTGGFGRYRDGSLLSYTSLPVGFSGPVRSFAEDPQGRLWVAAGTDLLLLDRGRLTAFPGWRPSSLITTIYRDPLGGMWVGADWDGFYQ
jgi:ligand-binding sensor domain-containing protein